MESGGPRPIDKPRPPSFPDDFSRSRRLSRPLGHTSHHGCQRIFNILSASGLWLPLSVCSVVALSFASRGTSIPPRLLGRLHLPPATRRRSWLSLNETNVLPFVVRNKRLNFGNPSGYRRISSACGTSGGGSNKDQ
eukprot:1368135-Amorphochlora_amoeboformis.AAC.1